MLSVPKGNDIDITFFTEYIKILCGQNTYIYPRNTQLILEIYIISIQDIYMSYKTYYGTNLASNKSLWYSSLFKQVFLHVRRGLIYYYVVRLQNTMSDVQYKIHFIVKFSN